MTRTPRTGKRSISEPRLESAGTAAVLLLAALASAFAGAAEGGIGEWSTHGPPGGNVRALAIDPSDSSTLYAGTSFRGLFKSLDGGGSWTSIPQGPESAVHIAVDPENPSILYVGAFFRGLYKSVDGGESWSHVFDEDTRVVAVDPRLPATLYAGGRRGIFKSEDGGGTWRPVNRGLVDSGLGSSALTVLDIVLAPRDFDTLYVAVEGAFPSDDGVFKSVDGGESWTPTNDAPLEGTGITDLVVDPQSSSVLYVGTGRGVFRSEDGGDSWRTLTRLSEVRAVAIDPVRPSTLYAGASGGLFESVDSGASWRLRSRGLEEALSVRTIAVDPRDPAVLYAGTEGSGIYKSVDGARSWQSNTTGPPNDDDIRTLAVDPRSPLTLYAGGNNGLHKSADGGLTWRRLGPPVRYITDLAIDPSEPETLYVSAEEGGVYKSLDGGETWRDVSHGIAGRPADRLVVDPADPATIYAGISDHGVYKSVDGGNRWAAASAGLPVEDFLFGGLLISPFDTRTLYAGIRPGRFNRDSGVYKSTDGGSSWFLSGFDATVRGLAIDPHNPSILYAGTNTGDGFAVWKSTDSGRTWFPTGEGLTRRGIVTALAVDPNLAPAVYAGTSEGILRSLDGGETWTVMSAGIPGDPPYVLDLVVAPVQPTTIYAGIASTSDSLVGGVFAWTEAHCDNGVGACLGQGRFMVEVSWQDFGGRTGLARSAPVRSDDSAVLWFFEPENWEILVKVLDGCEVDGHYWFYASAATDVGYTVRAADLASGVIRTYVNPPGRSARAIVDNRAFATCP